MTITTQIQNIVTALELDELEPAEQEEIMSDLNEMVFKGTLVRLLEQMDESTRASFEVLLEKDAPEQEIKDFIQNHAPHASTALADTLNELTGDILAATKK